MRRVFGPRTVVEAAFLVAVPVVAAAIGSSTSVIIAASAVGYLLIIVLEATVLREGRKVPALPHLHLSARTDTVVAEPAGAAPVESVVVQATATPPPPAPAPAPAPVAPPAPPVTAPSPSEHVRVLRPEPPRPEPVPEPAPVAERPPLAAVPEPEPEPQPAPAVEPAPSTVVPIGIGAGPRQWNLWDLERATREHAGPEPAQDEERQFLLLYLREFAGADGLLPIDFDGLVRDSFGELMGAR